MVLSNQQFRFVGINEQAVITACSLIPTKLLVIGTRQMLQKLPNDFHVTILGKRIDPAKSARDLGIQIDSTLSFDEHVANTSASCIASLCQINRVKRPSL